MNKICSWCLQPIGNEEEFLVTEQWDFLHRECNKEYEDSLKENQVED